MVELGIHAEHCDVEDAIECNGIYLSSNKEINYSISENYKKKIKCFLLYFMYSTLIE